jgi:hypothetical protein
VREVAEAAKPKVHAGNHHALRCHGVERVDGSAAMHHRAAVYPDHHQQRLRRSYGRAPDIDGEAVLGLRHIVGLYAGRAEPIGFLHPGPRLHRLRVAPVQIADWWRGIRNALPTDYAVGERATHGSALYLDNGGIGPRRLGEGRTW